METLASIKSLSRKFQRCTDANDLARLLYTDNKTLSLAVFDPLYLHFKVPKKNGLYRQIEAPNMALKALQRKLVKYLNAQYFLIQSLASFGYICKVRGQKNTKNIYTNAVQHLGNAHLLNMDFENFFHQISKEAIFKLFTRQPFQFNKEAALLLARLCTYKNRLPMGAPTSPVLSNFYTLSLDKKLSEWALINQCQYSRYVDDLSFSSNQNVLNAEAVIEIEKIGLAHNLKFNKSKIKHFGKYDVKKITGLVLNKTVDIDPLYYSELEKDILRLKHVMEVYAINGNTQNTSFIKTFKQEVMGKINFVATIEGYDSPQYTTYIERFHAALDPPEELKMRWTQFSNYI